MGTVTPFFVHNFLKQVFVNKLAARKVSAFFLLQRLS